MPIQIIEDHMPPEPIKILTLKIMIFIAWCNGTISENQINLINHKIDSMNLSERAFRLIQDEIISPPQTPKFNPRVFSTYELRLFLYTNCFSIVVINGTISQKERSILDRLLKGLNIQIEDAKTIEKETINLFETVGVEAFTDARQPQENEDQDNEIQELVNKTSEAWNNLIQECVDLCADIIKSPLIRRFETNIECHNADDLMAILDFNNLKSEILKNSDIFFGQFASNIDAVLVKILPHPDKDNPWQWSSVVMPYYNNQYISGLKSIFSEYDRLQELMDSMRKHDQSLFEICYKGAAKGYSAAPFGPLGILAATAEHVYSIYSNDKTLQDITKRYQNGLSQFTKDYYDYVESTCIDLRKVGEQYILETLIDRLDVRQAHEGLLENFLSDIKALEKEVTETITNVRSGHFRSKPSGGESKNRADGSLVGLIREQGREEKVRTIIQAYLSDYTYVWPNIPSKKLSNALAACSLPFDTKILGLVDLTLFGSAKECLLFTPSELLYHDDYENLSVRYDEFYTSKLRYDHEEEVTILADRLIYLTFPHEPLENFAREIRALFLVTDRTGVVGDFRCTICGKDPATNIVNGKRYCNDCL